MRGCTATSVGRQAVPTEGGEAKALDTGQSLEVAFTAARDYDYFCGLHPHMKGKIIVTPE